MNPIVISTIAIIISIASFLFTIWSRKEAKRVQVAEKRSKVQITMCELGIALERQLTELNEAIAVAGDTKNVHFEPLVALREKISNSRKQLQFSRNNFDAMPHELAPSDTTVVRLEEVLGGFVRQLKIVEYTEHEIREIHEEMAALQGETYRDRTPHR